MAHPKIMQRGDSELFLLLNVKTCNFSSLHNDMCSWSWKVDPTPPKAIGMLALREAYRSSQVAMTTIAE